MFGCDSTVNEMPLLDRLFTVTTTGPDVAPVGTGTVMLLGPQAVGKPETPLNVTVLVPWAVPKFDPEIVTEVPNGPDVGDRLVMLGTGGTVKATPLLADPPTVTTTGPEVAPAGTGTTIVPGFQLVGVPAIPLNVTVLVP